MRNICWVLFSVIFWSVPSTHRSNSNNNSETCVVFMSKARSVKLVNLFVHNDYHITENSQLVVVIAVLWLIKCQLGWFLSVRPSLLHPSKMIEMKMDIFFNKKKCGVWARTGPITPIDNLLFPKLTTTIRRISISIRVDMAQAVEPGHSTAQQAHTSKSNVSHRADTGALTHHTLHILNANAHSSTRLNNSYVNLINVMRSCRHLFGVRVRFVC